jgi:hypothetical protein
VGYGRQRRKVFASGGNGGRWRTGGLARGRKGWGFIGRAARRGGFARPSSSTGATVWAKGGGVMGERRRPMAGRACELRRVRGGRVAPD